MWLAIAELGPLQLTFYTLRRVHAQAAGQTVDPAVGQCLELAQARCQAIGVNTHGVEAAQAATGLWPLCGHLLAQRVVRVQQPGCFTKTDAVHVVVLVLVAIGAEYVGGRVNRNIACVLIVQGRLDLLGLLRGGSQEDEFHVLAASRLG